MTCPSCGAKLSCGCQNRKAANGKACCANCIATCNKEAGSSGSGSNKPKVTVPKTPYTPHT